MNDITLRDHSQPCEHGRVTCHWVQHTTDFCPGGRERTFETYLAEVQLPGRFAEFIDVLVEVSDVE